MFISSIAFHNANTKANKLPTKTKKRLPITTKKTSTATNTSSCNSASKTGHKVWQELNKDTDGTIRMIRVEDFGIKKTTRKPGRISAKNKPSMQQEAEKINIEVKTST